MPIALVNVRWLAPISFIALVVLMFGIYRVKTKDARRHALLIVLMASCYPIGEIIQMYGFTWIPTYIRWHISDFGFISLFALYPLVVGASPRIIQRFVITGYILANMYEIEMPYSPKLGIGGMDYWDLAAYALALWIILSVLHFWPSQNEKVSTLSLSRAERRRLKRESEKIIKLKAGEFVVMNGSKDIDLETLIEQDATEIQPFERKTYCCDKTLGLFSLAAERLLLNPEHIYYPCCDTDVTPSKAFPNANVVYADINIESVIVLQEAGYVAYERSAKEYYPDKVELLILWNPAIDPDMPCSHLIPGTYLFCNNYHQTAEECLGLGMRLIAIVNNVQDVQYHIVQSFQNTMDFMRATTRSKDDLFVFLKV